MSCERLNDPQTSTRSSRVFRCDGSWRPSSLTKRWCSVAVEEGEYGDWVWWYANDNTSPWPQPSYWDSACSEGMAWIAALCATLGDESEVEQATIFFDRLGLVTDTLRLFGDNPGNHMYQQIILRIAELMTQFLAESDRRILLKHRDKDPQFLLGDPERWIPHRKCEELQKAKCDMKSITTALPIITNTNEVPGGDGRFRETLLVWQKVGVRWQAHREWELKWDPPATTSGEPLVRCKAVNNMWMTPVPENCTFSPSWARGAMQGTTDSATRSSGTLLTGREPSRKGTR